MELRSRRPAAGLASIVRAFTERRALLGEAVATATLPARPDQFIELYLHKRYGVSHDGGAVAAAPEMAVVGPQSYARARLFMSGSIHVFTIHFRPGGFHALFGTPMPSLVNEGAPAGDVIGAAAGTLRDAVLRADGFDARVAAAEGWLGRRLPAGRIVDPVARMAALLQRSGGRIRIDALARRAGLGDRQFTRRFTAQVGLTPKLFARAVRFNAVLAAREAAPDANWTQLAHDAGYADQSHFIRDCHALAGAAPSDFFARRGAGQ